MLTLLPIAWRREFADGTVEPVETGMSDATVFRLRGVSGVRYLKIAEGGAAEALRQEIARTAWLGAHRIRVPAIIKTHDDGGAVAMLTHGLDGTRVDESAMPPGMLVAQLGRALAALHALPSAACPFDETLAVRLARAGHAVERDEVDVQEFAPRNRGVTPVALLARLYATTPPEDIVVVHGDASLSNMIVGTDGTVGFLDCGQCGRADRYLDLAVIGAEISEDFGRRWLKPFVTAYGEPRWNVRKAAFYSDLYELF